MIYKVQPLQSDFPGANMDEKLNYVLSLQYNVLSTMSDGDLLKCFALLYTKQMNLSKVTLASELRAVRKPYDSKANEIKTLFSFDDMTVMFLMTDFDLGNFTVNFSIKKVYNINTVVDPLKLIAFLPELKSYLSFNFEKFNKDITAGHISNEFIEQARTLLGVPIVTSSGEPVMSISSKSFDVAEFSSAIEVK